MQCCTMTFQRAVGISFAVHAVLFGSALAVAHYSASSGSTAPGVLSVSLVGMSGDPSPVRRPAEARGLEPAYPGMPVLNGVDPAERELPASRERGASAAEPLHASAGGESGGEATFGYTPEQWGRLQTALEQAKTYPRFARERGIEGTVLVRFKVLPTGAIAGAAVARSSGAKVLDEASVRTIYRAAPLPYVEGWVEVPMVYRLRAPGEAD